MFREGEGRVLCPPRVPFANIWRTVVTPTPPNSPREELEARITALLLGELPAEKAASLRQAIAQDAELARLYDRLKHTVGIVRETVTSPEQEALASPDAPKLAPQRRAALLAAFKVIRPKELRKADRSFLQREWLAVAAMIVILCLTAAILTPNLQEARSAAQHHNLHVARDESLAEAPPQATLLARGDGGRVTVSGRPEDFDQMGRARLLSDSTPQNDSTLTFTRPAGGAAGQEPGSITIHSARNSINESLVPAKSELSAYASTPLPAQPPAPPQSAASEQSSERAARQLAPIALPTLGDTLSVVADNPNSDARTPLAVASKPASPVEDPTAASSGPRRASEGRGGGRVDAAARSAEYAGGAVIGGESARRVESAWAAPAPSGVRGVASPPPMVPPSSETPINRSSSLAYGITPVPAPSGPATEGDEAGKRLMLFADQDDGVQMGVRFKESGLNQQLATNVATPGLFTAGGVPAPQDAWYFRYAGAGGLGGAGNVAQSFDRFAVPPLESRPLDLLNGAASRSRRVGDMSDVDANGLANVEAKKAQAKDVSGKEERAGELSKLEHFNDVALGAVVQFDAERKNIVRDLQREVGQKLDEKSLADQPSDGRVPAKGNRVQIALPESERGEAAALVQDSRLFYEWGRLDDAEAKLKEALKLDPSNRAAAHYQQLVLEQRYKNANAQAENMRREQVLSVETAWEPQIATGSVVANPATGLPAQSAEWQAARRENIQKPAAPAANRPTSNIVEAGRLAEPADSKAGSVQFENVSQVLDRYQELTGRTVLRPESVPGTEIIIETPASLTREDELRALDSILSMNGITMTPQGTRFVKAVAETQAGQAASLFSDFPAALLTEAGAYVTHVVQLTNAAPDSVRTALQPLAKAPNSILTIPDTGLIVLRDKAENVKEMAALLKKLDAGDKRDAQQEDAVLIRRASAPIPQPEVATTDNAFSTFSLNVSDVSFKLAAASLEKGQMPDPATVRSEEFINAFDYRDPEPKGGAPIAFAWERARYPFAHDRDLLRFSVKTAASGRQPGRPLNLVLLLDNSGSMERADRVRIRQECLRVLASQLQPQDRVSVVAFARTARLWVDGLPGNQAGELPQRVGSLAPEGGTNLEDAMNVAYQTALRHFLANGVNRVVLLTDGAANLGDVEPESLKKKVEAHRKQGVALDCFGIGWDGLNDELLEALSRNGDGRYGFVNTPEAAQSEFAGQIAGALKVAASDVKVQVQWNPRRVTAYRQIGYAKHQLKKEQFRDNTVDAAEIGAAEAGNALYSAQVNPRGEGPLGVVRVRFKVPGTGDYREHEWAVPYEGAAKSLNQSSPALRLAASASAFSEWLVSSPFAVEVTPDKLLTHLSGVAETWSADPRPKKLEWMIRQARSVAGK